MLLIINKNYLTFSIWVYLFFIFYSGKLFRKSKSSGNSQHKLHLNTLLLFFMTAGLFSKACQAVTTKKKYSFQVHKEFRKFCYVFIPT